MGESIPIRKVMVVAAGSSVYGKYETIRENQMYTDHEHGGSQLYIITAEIGIGKEGVAEMNGSRLKKIDEERIVQDSIIIGFYKTGDASKYGTGKFTYENSSLNYPYNTEKTYIYVR